MTTYILIDGEMKYLLHNWHNFKNKLEKSWNLNLFPISLQIFFDDIMFDMAVRGRESYVDATIGELNNVV